MRRAPATRAGRFAAFAAVEAAGLLLPGVATGTKYDGSPVLTLGGCFLAGLATHRSAEPDTLVVRTSLDDRALLVADAPETYYVTTYYQPHAVVLVRLSRVDRDALHDILLVSWRLTSVKARRRRLHGRAGDTRQARALSARPHDR